MPLCEKLNNNSNDDNNDNDDNNSKITSCRRAAATVCPRPSPPPVGAEALSAAEQMATYQQFPTANMFSRPPLQPPDAPTRANTAVSKAAW